uniref:Cytotoxin-associated protein A n=1 Tax=Steinernema glaseri TaxID=37863 RepID=A0A1I8AA27_9BILA
MKEKYASQAGEKPFGGTRNQVTKVKESDNDNGKLINDLIVDKKATERILRKWDQSNPEAKNDQIYGKRRDATINSVGGRRFTPEEISKSRAAIPRFQNVKETAAAQNMKAGEAPTVGYRSHRQVTTMINGLDRTLQDQLDTNKYMAWIGGQVTLQSQSLTGGFQKPRDVVSTSYYDRLMSERKAELEAEKLRQRLLEEVKKTRENGDANGELSSA